MDFSLDRFYQLNRKAIIWIVLFVFIYVMRQFFTLIFLTFIIGFFALPASRFLARRLRIGHKLSIVLVYLGIFVGYIAIYAAAIPSLIGQVASMQAKLPGLRETIYDRRDEFVAKYPQVAKLVGLSSEPSYLREGDVLEWRELILKLASPDHAPSARLMKGFLPELRQRIDEAAIAAKDPRDFKPDEGLQKACLLALNRAIDDRSFYAPNAFEFPAGQKKRFEEFAQARAQLTDRETKRFNRLLLESAFPESIFPSQVAEDELQKLLAKYQAQLLEAMPQFAGYAVRFLVNSLLAILFSFLISYQYVSLSREVESLASSKLRDFFEEASQPVVRFAATVGQGFQAMMIVALITAGMLTPILFFLGIPSLALLALIIFVTSLLPVVGIPLEAAAVALVALNERGLETTIWAMAALLIVHTIIGYVITPIVFGRQFKINLVLILIILFIGNRVAGAWGMILGVPVANYILRDVLKVPIVEEVTGYQTPMARIASISRKYPVLGGGRFEPPAAPAAESAPPPPASSDPTMP